MRRKLNVKLVGSVLGGVAIAALLVWFVHEWQLKQNAYQLLERGNRAAAANDYLKASTYYGQYLAFVPDDADTLQKYAQALDQVATTSGERIDLVGKMEQVLRLKPNEHALRMRLVHNLIALNRLSDAMEHLKKLQKTWPEPAEVQHMLGWCHDAKQEYHEAVASFRAALKLNPQRIKSWSLLAEVLQERLKEPEEALKAMNDMVSANQSSYQAYLQRSQFHRHRLETKEAQQDLEQAVKLAPHEPAVLLEAADCARVAGDAQKAIELLQEGQKRHPENADFDRALANIKLALNKREEAITHLQDGLRKAPKSTDVAVLLIDIMIDQEQYPQAEAKIEELRDAGLRPALPNYLTARLRVASKQWAEAIKLLESVRQELGPNSEWSGRVHFLLGLCHRATGDHEQELLAFRRAVTDEPSWTPASLGLAEALLSNGRVEEAGNLLETLRKAKDPPPGYWLLLVRTLLERQWRAPNASPQWDRIEHALTQAGQAEPKNVGVLILRAEVLAAQAEFAQAKTLLEKCRNDYPQEVTVWCALAELAAGQGHWTEAETILGEAAARQEFTSKSEWRLAQAKLWARQNTDAEFKKLVQLSEAILKDTEPHVSLRRELADLWYRLGRWDRAEQLWRDLARRLPRDLRSRTLLLELALDKDEPLVARRWLGDIRGIEGEHGMLWRYGAAAICIREAHGQRRKLDDARKLLKELQQQHPDWPRIALLSATIFEMEGHYQSAIQQYMRALEQGAMQPRMMARLLELLLQRREFGKAETELAKYEQKLPLTKDLARLGAEAALGMRDKKYAAVALRRAEQAVTLPTQDYRELLWLARICRAAGENERAEKLLRESIELAGHAPDTWIALVEHFARIGQQPQALKELERLKKSLPPDRLPLTLARCYEAMQMPAEAEQAYRTALKAAPGEFAELAFAADFFRQADHAVEAQSLYEQLLSAEIATPAEIAVKARRQLAILLAQRGDAVSRKKAIALLDENSKLRGATVAEERIRLFLQKDLNQLQASLDRQPPTLDERVMLADLLEAAGQLGPARSHLAEVVDQAPTMHYLVPFTRVLIKLGEFEEAQRMLARLEALQPSSERVRSLQRALTEAQKKVAALP
jgi:tetratricopeptide (TPR) repeat protein